VKFPVSNLLAIEKWRSETGISGTTLWRWRRLKMIATVQILGRTYISREEIARFEARAAAGEFARTNNGPRRCAKQEAS
jgi:hypothetical protein